MRIIPLSFDPIFKKVFKNSKEYTAKIVSIVTGIDYSVLLKAVYVDNELDINNYKEKHQKVDLIMHVDNNYINLEMNKNYYKSIVKKNTAYIFKINNQNVLRGETYDDENVYIQINFNAFNCEEEIVNEYLLMNKKTHKILTKSLRIINIDLEKIDKLKYTQGVNEELISYLKLIKCDQENELDEIAKDNKVLKGVVDMVKKCSEDNNIIGLYDADEEAEKVMLTRIKDAKKEGIEQGIEQNKIDIAKNLLKQKMDVKTISEVTGLTIDEIKNQSNKK